jgi:DNA mismatch endonuclease (patch repair protein)
MARIRSKDTKPEIALRRALWAVGVRGWRCHPKKVPGKPDLAFTKLRIAVFVDGRFWHGHPDFFTFGKSGDYWDKKIARTQERDRLANETLATAGWCVIRFWDFEVEDDLEACAATVAAAVATARAGGCPPTRLHAAIPQNGNAASGNAATL